MSSSNDHCTATQINNRWADKGFEKSPKVYECAEPIGHTEIPENRWHRSADGYVWDSNLAPVRASVDHRPVLVLGDIETIRDGDTLTVGSTTVRLQVPPKSVATPVDRTISIFGIGIKLIIAAVLLGSAGMGGYWWLHWLWGRVS